MNLIYYKIFDIIIGNYLLSFFYYKDIILDTINFSKINEATINYLKYARRGDPIARMEYGEEIEQDYFKAFEWYYKSAKNGSAEAQDYKKSFKCYLKNAESGSADIAMHMYDKETEINIEKIIIWYKKASDNRMKYAKY
ncbi:hypothetical protein RhiirC2_786325 [Rhizophagus irregularis]|uniref:Uncharacterized protein n=1 Tax=Rhizophagus irregularis TaxID=588596 RepID=A0A2N1MUJ0_9GLOM|nr:hypothetical protein RhiirC2_786325 [Rhizophagus irregularis]